MWSCCQIIDSLSIIIFHFLVYNQTMVVRDSLDSMSYQHDVRKFMLVGELSYLIERFQKRSTIFGWVVLFLKDIYWK